VKRLVLAGLLIMAFPAAAEDRPNGRMQACTQQWLEKRDAGETQAYKPFLKQCLTQTPAVAKTKVGARQKAGKSGPNRMKVCGARWRTLKAAGRTGGQSYRDFSRHCLKT
jgi:hypothetical protein